MMTPTLLDVATILSLPPGGIYIHSHLNYETVDLNYDVSDAEHVTFLVLLFQVAAIDVV